MKTDMLIFLEDGCWVDPREIIEVTLNDIGVIRVLMKNGISHNIVPSGNAQALQQKLVNRINEARQKACQ